MRHLILISSITLYSISLFGQEVFTIDNIAIRGYDPVAYFTEKKAVKGVDEFTFVWMDATWKFSSSENLNAFKQRPEEFLPQFGGYCAYGVSENHKSPTQPEAFTIVDGKLYLNYSLKVKELWNKDQPGKIKIGDKNWIDLKRIPME
jgi:hypothetical protein